MVSDHDVTPSAVTTARTLAESCDNDDRLDPQMMTIGIVDTVPLFRDGLVALIERTPQARLLAHAASQQGSLVMIDQQHPDVVLFTSHLAPRCEFIRTLTTDRDAPHVIVIVSDHDRTPRYLAAAMAAGAHGAVARGADPQRFVEAIRSVGSPNRYLDPTLFEIITSTPPSEATTGERRPQLKMPLSRREFHVMQLIAEGKSNAEIATTLFLSTETVRTHVKSILRKLPARDRTHAVTIAFRSGLLPLTPLPPREPQDSTKRN